MGVDLLFAFLNFPRESLHMLSGEQIRQARQRAGLSQAQLASIVGVSQRSIGNYERGETISRSHMPRIEEALSAYLGTGDGPSLASASDAALLAEIARRFERGCDGDGNTAATNHAGGSPAKGTRKPRGERVQATEATPARGDSQPHLVVAPDDQ